MTATPTTISRGTAGEGPGTGLRLTILTLFFLSGACGLVYEVVWMRMLTLVFGATAFATSTILAAFFAGLALGSFSFGRIIDRGGNPLKIYAILEAGIGLIAFLMPLLFAGLNEFYVQLYRQFEIGFFPPATPPISFVSPRTGRWRCFPVRYPGGSR